MHEKAFSPVCVTRCLRTAERLLKVFSQMPHTLDLASRRRLHPHFVRGTSYLSEALRDGDEKVSHPFVKRSMSILSAEHFRAVGV